MGKGTSKVSAVGTGFKEGDTPKDIDPDAIYSVSKVSGATGKATDYGNLTGEDIKPMLKGYKYNGLFWEKKGSMTAYDVVLKSKPKAKPKKPQKVTDAQLKRMSRSKLVELARAIFINENSTLSASEADYRARSLMSGNTDAQLRKYIKKHSGKR